MFLPNEELSTTLGWVSIACWIIVYSPQIIENYRLKSGEGLSVPFVIIWLIGDLFNLFGAILAALQPTVVLLAVYYTICDLVLLFQIYFYRWKAQRIREDDSNESSRPPSPTEENSNESTPLLARKDANLSTAHWKYTKALAYLASLGFVIGVGIIAWVVAQDSERGAWIGIGMAQDGGGEEEDIIEWKSQSMGWLSAVLYLTSRIPQIVKNQTTHCAGLSIALFLYAIGGNLTYMGSILAKSMESKHLVANASWLVGSGGTVFLDLFVAGQFIYYRRARQEDALKASENMESS